MDAALEQQVRVRAYDMWVASGRKDGSAEVHWISAERAILSEAMQGQKAPKSTKPRAAKAAAPKAAAAKPAKAKTAA